MPHIVYILECVNGAYYTGYTTDLKRRYEEHLKGSSKCKYTRSFPPKCIAAYWLIEEGRGAALQFEKHLKSLSREEKSHLIRAQLDQLPPI